MPNQPAHADLLTLQTTALGFIAQAKQLLLQQFGQGDATEKLDGTLVTQTDRAVDDLLVSQLRRAFPDHAVLSEEQNTLYDPRSPFTWVIDPLDGTTNFARGLPIWGISIALLFKGRPLLGVLSFPLLREEYAALHLAGALLNGQTMKTSPKQVADAHHFIMLCTRTQQQFQISSSLKPRVLGSATYNLVSVANGAALAAIEATPKVWDIAAALLILTEAGGCYRGIVQDNNIFPLASERKDYAAISISIVAAANSSILQELQGEMRPTLR